MRCGAHAVKRQPGSPLAAISHVFTLPRAAARLGVSEELLEIAIGLEPEDGPRARLCAWQSLRKVVPCLDDTAPFIADGVIVHRTSSTQPVPMKLHARYVTISDFDDRYFEVSFGNEHPAADYDPDTPMRPYVLLQRQFEDEDGGVCYLETHDPDRYVGHLRLRLVEFTPTRLAFEIDRPQDRLVEVTFRLGARRFREVQRVVNIIFGLNV